MCLCYDVPSISDVMEKVNLLFLSQLESLASYEQSRGQMMVTLSSPGLLCTLQLERERLTLY